jgi:hypothetical protein
MRSAIDLSTQVRQTSQKWLGASLRAIDGSARRIRTVSADSTQRLQMCPSVLSSRFEADRQ